VHELLQKIEARTARVLVIGVGYVGLPLVIELAKAGFSVTGYDKDPVKIRLLAEGESYIGDIATEELRPLVASGRITATTEASAIAEADAVIVCVPTPLNKTKDPDMRYIALASEEIAERQRPGMLIVLESTTYPGTTREILIPSSAKTSSWPSARSASTLGTSGTGRRTRPRSSAARRPRA
jgi:UDP-N-acetyl-D-glucosamine dehydrogenase